MLLLAFLMTKIFVKQQLYGLITRQLQNKILKKKTITKEKAQELFDSDVSEFEKCVLDNVNSDVSLSQCQFDALVSLAYNIGCGNFKSSTLLSKLNKKDYTGAAAQFLVWNKVKGKVSNGLKRRRAAEKALFEKCPCDSKPAPTKNPTPSPVQSTCEDEYIYIDILLTWEEANNYCLGHYGKHLATLTNENDMVSALSIMEGEYVWIGLKNIYTAGWFVWSDGTECENEHGACLDASFWKDGHPKKTCKEHQGSWCVMLYGG
eukprot:544600_1